MVLIQRHICLNSCPCYSNCVLVTIHFPFWGLGARGIFCTLDPDRQNRRSFQFGASIGGPMDHDLWCGSSMTPLGPPRSKRLHVGRMGVSIILANLLNNNFIS
ncbi:hypothetical protein QBC45DRAFT_340683 [Copromyces sp. CBS 386.78]|nr:hypothetical protein QBC45DRAFT_340683 [Copromyces sp. CBS 386.78]